MLVGTISIEKSEKLSRMLVARGVRHEVLNAKNHAREAMIIAEAGAKGSVTIATNMAGRGTDIKLGGNPEFRARKKAGTQASEEDLPQRPLAEEYAKWQADYQEVKGLGGLHVLGTERHEARRIDNQLRGRSGRQGDPGSSRFYISLEDDLMRLFGGENIKGLMSRMGMKDGEPIVHPWLNKSIERAQKKVEERNFEVRKHLLEYDDVLNEQRKFIYARRDEIISDPHLKDRVIATGEELFAEIFEPLPPVGGEPADARRGAPGGAEGKPLLRAPPERRPSSAALPVEQLQQSLLEQLRQSIDDEGGRDRRRGPEPVHPVRVPAQHRFALAGPPGEPRVPPRGGLPARLQPEEPAAGIQAGRASRSSTTCSTRSRRPSRARSSGSASSRPPESRLPPRVPCAGVQASHNAMGQFAAGGSGTTAVERQRFSRGATAARRSRSRSR